MSHKWKKLVDDFDFDRAARYMQQANWIWTRFEPPRVPTAADLKKEAVKLFEVIVELDADAASSGGLEARYLGNGVYMLSWGITRTEGESDD